MIVGMRMRLRQIALVAEDLAAAEAAIERQLGVELCFRDPGVGAFGLANALYPVGDKLLEVVSPREAGTTAGRLLEKRGGDTGYMVILQVDDLGEMRRLLDRAAARIVFEAVADGVTGLHVHPRDIGGAILSVDETAGWDEWPWAGPTWRDHVQTDTVSDILAVEIEAEDPAAMAARWAEVIGRAGDGTPIPLDEGSIRFVASAERGEGVSGLDLGSAGPPREVEICGCQVRLGPPV
jgi:hypothetical protein